jgi:hypothetical protein
MLAFTARRRRECKHARHRTNLSSPRSATSTRNRSSHQHGGRPGDGGRGCTSDCSSKRSRREVSAPERSRSHPHHFYETRNAEARYRSFPPPSAKITLSNVQDLQILHDNYIELFRRPWVFPWVRISWVTDAVIVIRTATIMYYIFFHVYIKLAVMPERSKGAVSSTVDLSRRFESC